MTKNDFCFAITESARLGALKKVVFSKLSDKNTIKKVGTLRKISGKLCLQIETFTKDNKALHENIILDEKASNRVFDLATEAFQINLITSVGDAELLRSKSGNETEKGSKKILEQLKNSSISSLEIAENNNEKNYLIPPDADFLKYLGVSDKNGRVHDSKQSKYRQINKFVDNVKDIYKHLPSDGEIVIYDLCCGKSYLSFAIYYYLVKVLKRDIFMVGADLKKDVIEYCNKVAKDLDFSGLKFYCCDINKLNLEKKPDLVVSLHACDIATDIVIEKAIAEGAKVVLSTPCCHHELNHTINCESLKFITEYSMLRQKLCDAATDALRLKLLEANCYSVSAVELIDPEETPKNILLRAIKKVPSPAVLKKAEGAKQEYEKAKEFLLNL